MSAHTNRGTSPMRPREARLIAPRRGTRQHRERTSLPLRLRVYLKRGRLDRSIGDGREAEASVELLLRIEQLTSPANQRRVARDLRRIVDYADRHRSGRVISSVVIDPSSVRRGRWAISELAEQLERGGAVEPRGIVLANELLTNGLGPLFNRHADRTVARAVRDVRAALEPVSVSIR